MVGVRAAGRPRRSSRDGWDSGPRDFFILQRAFEAEAYARVPRIAAPTPQVATNLLRRGTPLISWEALSLDWPLFQQWLREILATFSRCLPRLNRQIRSPPIISDSVEQIRKAVRAVYLGCALPRSVAGNKAEREVYRLAIQFALRLFLCPQRANLSPLVKEELWTKAICPVCGGLPDIALLNQEQGARWLVCCRCDTRWLFKMEGCPYCSCTEPASLSYLTPEKERCRRYLCFKCSYCYCTDQTGSYGTDPEKEICRLYLCAECHHYLRTVNLNQPESQLPLYLLRWQTFKLDRQAHPRGYRSPTGMSSLFDLTVRTGQAAGGLPLRLGTHRLDVGNALPGAMW
ncbi:MAG: hypothetical protein HW414_1535 [Dehalococcoidia bacterium]|nr:hypothetical protein [Dehalococcoidia bacterium]